jgi:diguanylate cyclase (GGDEF)-like protein
VLKRSQNRLRAFDPRHEPSQRLTIAYILALFVIASFTIGTHFFVVKVTAAQKEIAHISHVSARQRMLSQQVVLYAMRYKEKEREEDRRNARESIDEFERGHKYLAYFAVKQGRNKRFKSQALYDIYFTAPDNLDIKAGLFIKKTRDFLGYQDGDNVFQRDASLEYIRNLSMGPLLDLLNKVTARYEEEALQEMKRLEDIQLQAMFVVLGVLFLEAMLIFWPLVRHVRSYSRELLDRALYDYLTGLHNRWAFMERVGGELSRSQRHRRAYCFAVADIDGFKKINDTYGHETGDMVLQHFAGTLRSCLRTEDIVGRIGGEEFGVFLPETPESGGRIALERLRRLVEKSSCDAGRGIVINYTVSIGMVGNDEVIVTPTDNLARLADAALYRAKQGGRNRVEISPPPEGFAAEGDPENGEEGETEAA